MSVWRQLFTRRMLICVFTGFSSGLPLYLLFNLLAGVSQIPEDLKEAARSFGLGRLATWRKLVLPAVTALVA